MDNDLQYEITESIILAQRAERTRRKILNLVEYALERLAATDGLAASLAEIKASLEDAVALLG